MIKEKISRSFKRDFPDAVPLVEALGLRVQASHGARVNGMPTYWLDGHYQLTGYKTADGAPFTKETAVRLIRKLLQEIADGRAEVAALTRRQRFDQIVSGMKTLELRYDNFCSYRHPSGDEGCILFRGDPVTAWVRFWDENDDVANVVNVRLSYLYSCLEHEFEAMDAAASARISHAGTGTPMGRKP